MLRLCFILLLLFGTAAAAQEPSAAGEPKAAAQEPKGPPLADLMKLQNYREAWEAMLKAETLPVPDWVTGYTATLDSPPIPSFGVLVGSQAYTLAFTCKPNDCENHQLFVLFAPDGRHAWALLLTAGGEPRWLGNPDDDIKGAMRGSIE
ncbi:MAG: inhibitor of vertebrate lysozyme family protein [Methyloceanibacter sp.]|nr:inhibitor of vertebrate lysozyme family protein [Methyloceanibacter sp.]